MLRINIIQIVLIIIFTYLAYWANTKVNGTPVLNNIVSVLIVVIGVVLLVASLFGKFNSHITIN